MSRPRSIGLVERRAVKARLSTFLAVACMVAGPLTTAATSSAAPLAPKLTHTDPASLKTAPALSTMPRIFGEGEPEEGGITRVFGSSRLFGPVIRGATQNPTFQIQIFASSNCQGAVLQTGTAGELEGAGILVTVGENALTTLSARQVDPDESSQPSDCSNDLPYWEGAVPNEEPSTPPVEESAGPPADGSGAPSPGGGGGSSSPPASGGAAASGGPAVGGAEAVSSTPPAAPHLRTVPGGIANNAAPVITGTAPGAGSVRIFTDPKCEGSPVASGPVAQFASGFPVTVVENSVVSFYGVAVNSAGRSRCSEPVQYVEDSLAPLVRITMGPAAKTRKRTATFRFLDVNGEQPGTSLLLPGREGEGEVEGRAARRSVSST